VPHLPSTIFKPLSVSYSSFMDAASAFTSGLIDGPGGAATCFALACDAATVL
jgi:hypothetical protein